MDNKKYYLGMYEKSMPKKLSWKEKLEFAKAAGFDWLEISIDETAEKLARLDWDRNTREQLIKDMYDTGTPILTMCLSGHRKYPLGSTSKKTQLKSLEIMRKAVNLAADLGIRIIQLAGYDVYYENGNEQTRQAFIDNLKIAAIMAAEKGILMGFETMETPFMDTVEKAMNYVSLVNSPYLQIYPDLGNLTNASKLYKVAVEDDLRKGTGHIVAAHLKETVSGKYREIPYGTGHTDFVKDIQVLRTIGVRMFTGEFWYVGQDNWQETCRQANVFLRDKLDRVFND